MVTSYSVQRCYGFAMATEWTLLSTHGLVLVALARDGPVLTLRQIGDLIGITERSAFRIVCELEESGFLVTHKIGRRNVYEIRSDTPLRHPMMQDLTLADLLGVLLRGSDPNPQSGAGLEEPHIDLRPAPPTAEAGGPRRHQTRI